MRVFKCQSRAEVPSQTLFDAHDAASIGEDKGLGGYTQSYHHEGGVLHIFFFLTKLTRVLTRDARFFLVVSCVFVFARN